MIKKKILSTGAAAIVAISCFGTSAFANSKTDFKNSVEVDMTVDADGNIVYEYTDADGITRTSGTSPSMSLTKGRFDSVYSILKFDKDDVVITVKSAPTNGKVAFEIISQYNLTVSSSNGTTYGKGSTWIGKADHALLGVQNTVRANPTVSGSYTFTLQW